MAGPCDFEGSPFKFGFRRRTRRALKTKNPALAGLLSGCARQGALTWRWKSSTDPARGTVSRTARVSRVTANLKEAEGKALA
jgi:hypothetical protein